jgi:hypothetical protein
MMTKRERAILAQAARILASFGGKARAESLTPKKRKQIASDAARTRWRGTTRKERSKAASDAARARWAKTPPVPGRRVRRRAEKP